MWCQIRVSVTVRGVAVVLVELYVLSVLALENTPRVCYWCAHHSAVAAEQHLTTGSFISPHCSPIEASPYD